MCAIKRTVTDGSDVFDEAVPIAGELKERGGGDMNAKWELLKTSSSHADSEKEGLRVEMNGGFRKLESGKRKQKAIIEFICDKTRTGLEHLYDPEDKYEQTVKREENDGAADSEDPNSSSLKFVRYDEGEGDADVLRLSWQTKYACEGSKDEQDAENGSHWGFFTWFILMCVLSFGATPKLSSSVNKFLQCLPLDCDLFNFWLVAQLQSIWRTRLGPPPSWRHDSRCSISVQRLDAESPEHNTRRWKSRWICGGMRQERKENTVAGQLYDTLERERERSGPINYQEHLRKFRRKDGNAIWYLAFRCIIRAVWLGSLNSMYSVKFSI